MGNNVELYTQTYVRGQQDGESKVVSTYQRFRIVTAWRNKTLIPMVNVAMRNGWVVTHWETHHGFFPAARLVKTLVCGNDEELPVS